MFNSKKVGLVLALSLMLGSQTLGQVQTDKQKDPDRKPNIGVMFGGKRLGIIAGIITSERAKELKLGEKKGVFVQDVFKDTAADRAGLRSGDVIIEMDGQPIESYRELRSKLQILDYGKASTLRIIRDGSQQQLSFTLDKSDHDKVNSYAYGPSKEEIEKTFEKAKEARKKAFESRHYAMENYKQEIEKARAKAKEEGKDFSFAYNFGRPRLGVGVEELTEQLGKYFGVEKDKGVLVTEVVTGSAAEQAGIQAGDVILEVNGVAINHNIQLRRELKKVDAGEVRLTIVRNRQKMEIRVNIEKASGLLEKDFYAPFADNEVIADLLDGKSQAFHFEIPDIQELPQLEGLPELPDNPEFHFNFSPDTDLQDLDIYL